MNVLVEFFGIPRQRAGLARLSLSLPQAETAPTLGEVLSALGNELPDFARACLDGNQLRPGLLANVDGKFFTTDPATEIPAGASVLILSADVGG